MQLTVNTANIHADIMAAESWACCSKKKKQLKKAFLLFYISGRPSMTAVPKWCAAKQVILTYYYSNMWLYNK